MGLCYYWYIWEISSRLLEDAILKIHEKKNFFPFKIAKNSDSWVKKWAKIPCIEKISGKEGSYRDKIKIANVEDKKRSSAMLVDFHWSGLYRLWGAKKIFQKIFSLIFLKIYEKFFSKKLDIFIFLDPS